jgi:hypothetical protein
MASTSKKNHEKAPLCAGFVKDMREVFGADQIEVQIVSEGEVQLGMEVYAEVKGWNRKK